MFIVVVLSYLYKEYLIFIPKYYKNYCELLFYKKNNNKIIIFI